MTHRTTGASRRSEDVRQHGRTAMLAHDAEAEYLRRLTDAQLELTALDFWETWRVFKTFLAVPVVDDVYDAASFQCEAIPGEEGPPDVLVYFVRQFSRRRRNGIDALVTRVVTEFIYPPLPRLKLVSTDMWTHDFPTLAEWASAVEGLEQFQQVQAARASTTCVYGDQREWRGSHGV
jgi:hypothetical protein